MILNRYDVFQKALSEKCEMLGLNILVCKYSTIGPQFETSACLCSLCDPIKSEGFSLNLSLN